jgi:hypothetical protein
MAPHATCTKSDAQTQVSAAECTDFYESDEGIRHIDLAASSWKPSLPRLSPGGVEFTQVFIACSFAEIREDLRRIGEFQRSSLQASSHWPEGDLVA